MSLSEKRVLVLGGGIAGVTVALELMEQGVEVVLAERRNRIGGYAAHIACKALESCQSCNGCLVEPRLVKALTSPALQLHLGWEPTSIERENGSYITTLGPGREDPGSTLDRLDQGIYGPEALGAGRAEERPEAPLKIRSDAVVLATGYQPYQAENKPRLGFGRLPNVITAWDLEDMLRSRGSVTRPSDGEVPKRIAFIQCVGSRERKGHNYCSRICCGFGLRLARAVTFRSEAEVSVFYMDIQTFGHSFESFLGHAQEELELIRCLPADILAGENETLLIQYQAEEGQPSIHREFDLLVLSVGLTPGSDNPALAEMLNLSLGRDGFFIRSEADPEGIFTAGTTVRPMDSAETIAHAGRTVEMTISYLEGLTNGRK